MMKKLKLIAIKIQITNSCFQISSTKTGGVAFYIPNFLKYTKKEDLELKSEDFENIFIELNITPRKALVIGLIYRHLTNNFTQFQQQLTNTLNKLNNCKQEYILVGNYNIDLLKKRSNLRISKYLSAFHVEDCRA